MLNLIQSNEVSFMTGADTALQFELDKVLLAYVGCAVHQDVHGLSLQQGSALYTRMRHTRCRNLLRPAIFCRMKVARPRCCPFTHVCCTADAGQTQHEHGQICKG